MDGKDRLSWAEWDRWVGRWRVRVWGLVGECGESDAVGEWVC